MSRLTDLGMPLLAKLGSIAVHTDELIRTMENGEQGALVDIAAIQTLLDDAEVKAWLKQMDEAALLPKRR